MKTEEANSSKPKAVSTGLPRPYRRRWLSTWALIDPALWAPALVVAIWLRYEFSIDSTAAAIASHRVVVAFVLIIGVQTITGYLTGLYRGLCVRDSPRELVMIGVVAASGGLAVIALTLLLGPSVNLPRSVIPVATAFAFLLMLQARYVLRYKRFWRVTANETAEPAIVFGAGTAGCELVRQIRYGSASPFRVAGILDDDPAKSGMVVQGIKVSGSRDDIAQAAAESGSATLIIAIPSLVPEELRRIRDAAESTGLRVLVLPPLNEMMQGRVEVNELREIDVHDLLGRSPINLDLTAIAESVRGRRILVTGAGGSIGSELCRQLSRFRPAELIMVDRDESALHAVQLSIEGQSLLDGDDTVLIDIRDAAAVRRLFMERRPELVMHAAALKHLPLLEKYPLEALKTNVLGTHHVIQAAVAAGVDVFVNISTDKAANPVSVLGESKRITERLTAAAGQTARGRWVSVRFGNVLGSRGSVLTAFEKQITAGGPVTVTDPKVTRFFMTIPEACQLVLQAAVVAESGETMVLDMGEPLSIDEVARTLISRSGKPDIEIVYTGLREGEKLEEDLFDSREEATVGDRHPLIAEVRVPPLNLDLDEIDALSTDRDAHDYLSCNVRPQWSENLRLLSVAEKVGKRAHRYAL